MLKTLIMKAVFIAFVGSISFTAHAIADTQRFDVPAGDLIAALESFAKQADVDLVYQDEQVEGLRTGGVSGNFSPRDAVMKLLEGTSLQLRTDEASGALLITTPLPTGGPATDENQPKAAGRADSAGGREKSSFWNRLRLAQAESDPSARSARSEPPSAKTGNSSSASAEAEKSRIVLEEIVVTGTNIRGVYPSSSPVEIYTAEDIARTGATTTGQFISKLPQNLGTSNSYQSSTGNVDAVEGINLRGLGDNRTLVLMNGRRLALSDSGQNVDIALIPASAIERIEVLTDGASAIYGSDAVGGVVNFILRDDFSGAETRLNYGGVTSGGLRQQNLSQTFGGQWNSGHGLISYDYFSAEELLRNERDFTIRPRVGPGTLTPEERRRNLFMTVSQDLGERLSLAGTIAYGERDVSNVLSDVTSTNALNHSISTATSDTESLFVNLGTDYEIGDSLNASFVASYSRVEMQADTVRVLFNRVPETSTLTIRDTDHSALDLTAKLDGALFAFSGGEVRFSLGAGLLDEEYSGRSVFLRTIAGELGRETRYAFGELFVPLIGASQGIPLVNRLELSLAARYTDYADSSQPPLNRDFGNDVDPKIGLLWAPAPALNFRATYGTSFRAPTLSQLDPSSTLTTLTGGVPLPQPSGPLSTFLAVSARPDNELAPETGQTFTVGCDFRPAARPKFRLSATYYSVDYEDRIAAAPVNSDIFTNPGRYPDALYHPPSAAYIEAILRQTTNAGNNTNISLTNPATAAAALFADPNFYIFDQRFRNLALSEQDGVDLTIGDGRDTAWGAIDFGAQVTRVFHYRQRSSVNAPVIVTLDTLEQPVDLRGRLFAGLSRGGFSGTVSANYIDGYENPAPPSGIRAVISSWTTLDLNLSHDFGAGGSQGFLEGLRVSLSVQNLFDQDPPFAERSSSGENLGYDSVNSNPLGRLMVLGLAKTW